MSSSPTELKHFYTGTAIMRIGWFLAAVAGLLGLATLYLAIWPPGEDTPLVVRIGLLVVAAILDLVAGFGILVSLGGERIELDRAAGTLRIDRGRWYTWERETHELNTFKRVRCYRRIISMAGDHDSSADHPVLLCGPGVEVEVATHSSYAKSRATAEDLAKWLTLDFEDATERESVIRSVDEIDLSLVERLQRNGRTPQLRWPRSTRLQRSTWGDAVILYLPGLTRGQLLEGVFGVLFLVAIYGGAWFGMFYGAHRAIGSDSSRAMTVFWIAVVAALPVLWLLLLGIGLLVVREEVWVSTRGVQRRWRFPIGGWTTKLSAAEIEEIVEAGDNVILRSDRRSLRLGIMLPKAERTLLRRAVAYYLVGGQQTAAR